MTQPIRAYMPKKATYLPTSIAPAALKPDSRLDAILAGVIHTWQDRLDLLAGHLRDIEVLSLGPNKTGLRVSVRARIGGKAAPFSVCPFQGRSYDARTFDSLFQEVAIARLWKTDVFRDGRDRPVVDAVLSEALHQHGGQVFRIHALTALVDRLRSAVPDAGTAFAAFHREVVAFVKRGGMDASYDRHQVRRALDQFREMAVHALVHGARFDEMRTILDEALVRVTLEG